MLLPKHRNSEMITKLPWYRSTLDKNGLSVVGSIRCYWLAICVIAAVPDLSLANTDVVVFNNGDRLTGELKLLERGRLRFKTDATDTIGIEWENVAYLSSTQNIQVETANGSRFLGSLSRAQKKNSLIVETSAGPVVLESSQVVLMTPIEDKGIGRLDGDITAGYNFAKASDVRQLHLGLDVNYRTETRIVSLRVDAVTTDSQDNDISQRQSLDLEYTRLLPNHWLAGGVITLDRNDELGLDLRTSVGGGAGRILRQSNQTSLVLQGGLLLSRENISAGGPNKETVEAFGTLLWDWFRYDAPELDLSTSLQLIPNLTDTGRIRGEFDIKLKWEMVEDLFWQLSIYDSFDSDPVLQGAEKNDYGIITSLGWDF